MSIYPVKLKDWYPYSDEMYEHSKGVVEVTPCYICGKTAKYSKAIGHHSIPWGYGDIWCSLKCFNSDKIQKPDKRRLRGRARRYARKYGSDMFVKVG